MPDFANAQHTRDQHLSGADIGFKMINSAGQLTTLGMDMFRGFRARPNDLPELYYVLENGNSASKAMDQVTGL